MTSQRRTFLYLAPHRVESRFKIGISEHPPSRLASLPDQIEFQRTLVAEFLSGRDARHAERALHSIFRSSAVALDPGDGRSEWFHSGAFDEVAAFLRLHEVRFSFVSFGALPETRSLRCPRPLPRRPLGVGLLRPTLRGGTLTRRSSSEGSADRRADNEREASYVHEWLQREQAFGTLRGRCGLGRERRLWLSCPRAPERLLNRLSNVRAVVLRGPGGWYRLDSTWYWPGSEFPEVFLDFPALNTNAFPETKTLEGFLSALPDVSALAQPVAAEVARRRNAFRARLELD